MNPDFLREAIRLSLEKMEAGEGGPFGAVIVRNGEIVGRGWNRVTSTNDPTAHAEIVAIRDACGRLGTFSLGGLRDLHQLRTVSDVLCGDLLGTPGANLLRRHLRRRHRCRF